MNERPTAVTVFGWYWRVGGVVGMVLSIPLAIVGADWAPDYYPYAFLALPSFFQGLIGFLASVLSLLCGNGILKGQNWARALALALCFASTLTAVALRGHPLYWFSLIGNLAFISVMWFFLYRPQATAYFRRAGVVAAG